MLIKKAYKTRLYPTEQQKILLDKHISVCRLVYNLGLEIKIDAYKKGIKVGVYDLMKHLPELKREYKWIKEVNSQALHASLMDLDNAYNLFFKGVCGFPKFKSKKRDKNSFRIPQHITIKDNRIYILKFSEGIRMAKNLNGINYKGTIKNATITKTPTGKYYVSILVEEEYKPMPKTGKSIGVDLGISSLVTLSDGSKMGNPKHLDSNIKKLKKAQKRLSRKKKHTGKYNKNRMFIAKLHEKIANSRADYLHKISYHLVKNYDVIVMEDLNVKGMVKNHKLAKSISDCGWEMLRRFLEYKCQWNERQLIVIDRYFPSSKTCSNCGYIKEDMDLGIRNWTCPICDTNHDRDVNAAINILMEGTSDSRLGGQTRVHPQRLDKTLTGARSEKRISEQVLH